MYENPIEENNNSFEPKFPQPPYTQRNTSSNQVPENAQENIIPLKFENQEDIDLNVSYNYEGQGFSNMFSDKNQTVPGLSLLNETLVDPNISGGIISSLINDAQSRTPLDLIQADFPSTPSSIFGNRLLSSDVHFEQDFKSTELKVASMTEDSTFLSQNANRTSNPNLPSLLPVSNAADYPLEQPSKNFQKLYISSDLALQNQTNSSPPNMIPQFHAPLPSNNLQTNSPFFQTSPSPVPSTANNQNGSSNSLLLGSQSFNNNNNSINEPIISFPLSNQSSTPTPTPQNPTFTQSSNQNSANVVPTLVTNPTANNSQSTSQIQPPPTNSNIPALAMSQLNPQTPSFYMQTPYLFNPSGQMYYRTTPSTNQFNQEYVFPTPPVLDANNFGFNGLSLMATPADTSQIPLPQPQLPTGFVPFSSMSSLGNNNGNLYWASDQGVGPNIPVFVNGQQGIRVNLAMPTMDDSSRVIYGAPAGFNNISPNMQLNIANNLNVNRNLSTQPSVQFPINPNLINIPQASPPPNMPGLIPHNMVHLSNNDPINHPQYSQTRDEDRLTNSNRNNSSQNLSDNNDHKERRDNRDQNRDTGRSIENNRGNNKERNHRGNNTSSNQVNNGSNPVRDSLVEEFRSTFGKTRQWTLSDLANHIVAFCQDQHGSRFIQQRLEVCNDTEKQLVFDEILPSAQTLMTDVFGNYVLQKLFEYGSKTQCEELASLLKGQAVQLSMQMYGCRVVQKALEYVSRDRLVELVAEFQNPQMLIRCVHDSNGNHVIQKCIEVVSQASKNAESKDIAEYMSSRIQFIIDAFKGQVKELSSHPYGCRVVQRILEHCTDNQKGVILEELRQCCGELVQDCYGNYVIQFVMQHGWDADRAVLIKEVQSNLLDFSQHKFASNVVEKCLQFANKKDRDEMIWTIINVTFDINNPVDSKGHCVLESMVRDPYANYVVQKVIDVSDEKQRAAIMRYVKDNINQLRKYTYGKHIIVRLEKITNEKF